MTREVCKRAAARRDLYLPRRDGISVVRVLYVERDWWELLGML